VAGGSDRLLIVGTNTSATFESSFGETINGWTNTTTTTPFGQYQYVDGGPDGGPDRL